MFLRTTFEVGSTFLFAVYVMVKLTHTGLTLIKTPRPRQGTARLEEITALIINYYDYYVHGLEGSICSYFIQGPMVPRKVRA